MATIVIEYVYLYQTLSNKEAWLKHLNFFLLLPVILILLQYPPLIYCLHLTTLLLFFFSTYSLLVQLF